MKTKVRFCEARTRISSFCDRATSNCIDREESLDAREDEEFFVASEDEELERDIGRDPRPEVLEKELERLRDGPPPSLLVRSRRALEEVEVLDSDRGLA